MGEHMPKTDQNARDEDAGKGAVEQDRPQQKTNVSMTGQNAHRDQDPLLNGNTTDFPEPGENEEHSGEPRAGEDETATSEVDPQDETEDDTPGFRQKDNQNKSKDDPLAA
jgi:hypothetical protein